MAGARPDRSYSRQVSPRSPPMRAVSLPSMRATASRAARARGDSRVSRSCASSTTPEAPATQAAAAVCRPIPPWAKTGRAPRLSSRCSRMKVVSSPTRPAASCPLAMSPSTQRSAPWSASSMEAVSSRTSMPRARQERTRSRSSAGSPGVRMTVRARSGRAPTMASWKSMRVPSSRTPQAARARRPRRPRAASASGSLDASSRSSTPREPARDAAMATAGSAGPGGVRQMMRNSRMATESSTRPPP